MSPAPFAPRYWGIHLLMVAAVAATFYLGRWQYHVWESHRADDAASVTRLAPIPLDSVLGPDAAYPTSGLARPVVVEGTWDSAHTVYVSGRVEHGRTGYWAVTPVVTASGSEIPVVRGWAPEVAGAPAPPRGSVSMVGLLQPPDESGATDSDPTDDVIPELSITDLLQRASRDLYGGYVVATGRPVPGSGSATPIETGLTEATPEQLPGADASTALRNLLYAFQWWVFGAFAIFMWWRWLAEDVLGRGRPGTAGTGG